MTHQNEKGPIKNYFYTCRSLVSSCVSLLTKLKKYESRSYFDSRINFPLSTPFPLTFNSILPAVLNA